MSSNLTVSLVTGLALVGLVGCAGNALPEGDKVATATVTLASLDSRLTDVEAELATTTATVQAQSSTIAQQTTTIAAQDENLTQQTTTIAVLQGEMVDQEVALDDLEDALDDANDIIADLQDQLAAAQGAFASQSGTLSTLAGTVNGHTTDIAALNDSVNSLYFTSPSAADLAFLVRLQEDLTITGNNSGGDDLAFTGVNVSVDNGSGSTLTINGLGNLVVGYNGNNGNQSRTGSHNLVVGDMHTYTSYGGFVAGTANTISGQSASVCGGYSNTASAFASSVVGGNFNFASGQGSTVSGGDANIASGFFASVSGGSNNTASGGDASILGGYGQVVTASYGTAY